jgi:hypothetical protein
MLNSNFLGNEMNKHSKERLTNSPPIIHHLPAKAGIHWIYSAWQQFKTFPFTWMTLTVLYGLINFICTQPFFLMVVMPIFSGGLFIAAAAADSGAKPRLRHLLGAFTKAHAPKLIVTAILWFALACTFSLLLFFTLLGMGLIEPLMTYVRTLLSASPASFSLIALAIMLGLYWIIAYLLLAYELILGLIIFNDLSIFMAFRIAFFACLRNWRPLTFYMVVCSILELLSLLPLLMGWRGSLFVLLSWIILFPILSISHFYMWKHFFTTLEPEK